MNRVRDDVLPRAGLAENDDGQLAFRDQIDDAIELVHGVVGHDHGTTATPDERSRTSASPRPRRAFGVEWRANRQGRRPERDDLAGLDRDACARGNAHAGNCRPVRASAIFDARGKAPMEDGVLARDRRMIDA